MKAVRINQFGDASVLQVEELPDLQPSGKQVLIDVKAIGINPVDTYIRAGIYPTLPELPYTPGLDAAGVITAVGPEVRHRKVGQRVYCFGSVTGCYAEQVLCQESQVHLLPDNVEFTAGAAIGVPYTTAYFALYYRAHCLPGERLLVHGASGAVGLAALQIARASGIRTIGTAGTAAGLQLIRQQGAAALDHTEEDYLKDISRLTCSQGVNVVLEMLANVNLQADLEMLSTYGRVVVIGNRGSIEIDPRAAMGRNASILGMSLFNASEKEIRTIQAALHAGLENGSLAPVISKIYSLDEVAVAHEKVLQPGAAGKLLIAL